MFKTFVFVPLPGDLGAPQLPALVLSPPVTPVFQRLAVLMALFPHPIVETVVVAVGISAVSVSVVTALRGGLGYSRHSQNRGDDHAQAKISLRHIRPSSGKNLVLLEAFQFNKHGPFRHVAKMERLSRCVQHCFMERASPNPL